MSISENNKRIAINTMILYAKLVITTLVGIISVRFVLQALGAESYGLYAVVGGVVSMMNFLNTTMVSTSYRFIAVELGKPDGRVKDIYNAVRIIHFALAVLLFVVVDTIGIWYVNNHLNVASHLLADARFVLHISVFTTMFAVINVPNQGLVTAQEDFGISAIIHICKSLLTLVFVILLIYYVGNRLRLYAIIMAFLSLFEFLGYSIFCFRRYYEDVRFKINTNIQDYKDIFIYSWWTLFGAVANIALTQGATLIINYFFGTLLNAAFSIANQINSHVLSFARSIGQASIPQITKSYSGGDSDRSNNIVYAISRYTFLMMFMIAVPLLLSLDFVLDLWLEDVPNYTYQFTFLIILNALINCLGAGVFSIISATGKIRMPQIISSIILLTTLPLSIIVFYIGAEPYMSIIITILSSVANIFCFVYYAYKLGGLNYNKYIKETLVPIFKTILFVLPLFILNVFIPHNWSYSIFIIIVSFIIVLFDIYYIGFFEKERTIVKNIIFKCF